MMEEFKAVALEEDQLVYRYMSKLIALLPVLASQESDSNSANKFYV